MNQAFSTDLVYDRVNKSYIYFLTLGLILLYATKLSNIALNLETYLVVVLFITCIVINIPFGVKSLNCSSNKYVIACLSVFLFSTLQGIFSFYKIKDIVRDLSIILSLVTAFVITINSIKSADDFKVIERLIVFTALVSIPFYFASLLMGYRSAPNLHDYRVFFVLNHAATLYIFPCIILLHGRQFKQALFNTLADRIFLIIFVVAIFASLARTDYIILILVQLGVMFNASITSKRLSRDVFITVALLIVIILVMLSLPAITERLQSTESDVGIMWRFIEFDQFVRTLETKHWLKWLIGEGLGYRLPLPFAQKLAEEIFIDIPVTHNSYQFYAMKTGIIGLLVVVVPLGVKLFRYAFERNGMLVKTGLVILVILLKAMTLMGLTDTKMLVMLGIYLGFEYKAKTLHS